MKKWFENLGMSRKLSTGFLFVSFLSVIIGITGVINLINIANNQQKAYDQSTMGVVYSSKAQASLLRIRTLTRDLYLYCDTDKEKYCDEVSSEFTNLESLLENYTHTITDSQDQVNYDDVKSAYNVYKNDVMKIVDIAKSGNSKASVLTEIKNQKGSATLVQEKFDAMTEYNIVNASEQISKDKTMVWVAVAIVAIVVIISFIISMILSFYISGTISKPIKLFATISEMLAVGDIDVEKVIDEKDKLLKYRKDEVGTLALSFNKMISSTVEQAQQTKAIAQGDLTTVVTVRSEHDVIGKALHELVEKFHILAATIVSSANQVDSGSKQVSDSSLSLSQGASEQASSVEELTASLEEVTAQTTQNAQNAQTTDSLTKNIRKDAQASDNQMIEMLHAMDDINESSDNIGKIIKVIEDIAFQTNILALNAAVEAARAGEYGKGFAVVAEEVRSLAGQSAKAAKETAELIQNSIKKVDAGTKIANSTATSLKEIVSGISKAAELINSIAVASNEQATSLEQINQGITQVSEVVQGTAAASEECAAASEELSAQSNYLKKEVSVFKLDNCVQLGESHNLKGKESEDNYSSEQLSYNSNNGAIDKY